MAVLLTLAALAADPDRFQLIDVQDAEDYVAVKVRGAVHIPLADLEGRAGELPAGKTPAKICGKGGGRSTEGAEMLNKLGHPDAVWLEGGTSGWCAQKT